MFVDQVRIEIKAGKGGNGCMSFRREYRVPKGGPDGGRGGDGGSVYFVSERNLNSLAYFRFHPINKAKNGAHGEGSNRQGRKGADLKLRVPVGTVVKDLDKDEILFDFVRSDLTYLAAKGGRGGRGNASFATSTHQAPREWENGKPGEEKGFLLELRLIADVGLVGFPNAGKSTLLTKISAARPLIADYPFTTLVPHLGVVDIGEYESFVVADIPGLIEGAHLGQGLGIRFLKHIERTKILVHLIDVSPFTERDPANDYAVVMEELKAFNPQLAARPQIVVANKTDTLGENKSRLRELKELAETRNLPFFTISALKSEGLAPLIDKMAAALGLHEKNEKEAGR